MSDHDRSNLIVFGCGRKGVGKTRLLYHRYTRRTPRVVTLDVTGESKRYNPEVIEAFGLQELKRALAFCAARGRRWHVAAALDAHEIPALFRLLAPPFSARRTSLARAVGGLALECSEIDEIAPNAGADPEVIGAWRRGRHHLLSIYAATQRPASCARDVTAQADEIFAFQTTEPRDLDYLAKMTSSAIAEVVAELPKYHWVYYLRADSRVYLCDNRQRAYRVLSLASRAAS